MVQKAMMGRRTRGGIQIGERLGKRGGGEKAQRERDEKDGNARGAVWGGWACVSCGGRRGQSGRARRELVVRMGE